MPTFLLDVVASEEQLWACHGLELEAVVGGVSEKHGPLFPGHALEPQVWLDHEADAAALESGCELVEVRLLQHEAKVRHRHLISVLHS